MELDDLDILLDVARLGNFSRAARARNVAVSSVTRRIDLLEQDVGVALFIRSSRRVQLTDAGQQLIESARRVTTELADVRDAIASLQSEPTGTLTITAPATFGRRHVAPAVATFLLRHPAIDIDLRVTDDIVDFAAERVDVAVRIGVLPDSDLLATALAPQRRVAVASPAYLARAGRPAQPGDLPAHNCLTHGSVARRAGWWEFAGVNDDKPIAVQGNLRTDDSDSLMRAALAGVGIAHLATWLVGEEVAAGRLVMLFEDELQRPTPTRSAIHAVRLPGRAIGKSKLFVEHLRRAFMAEGDTPYWEAPFERIGRRAI